MDPFVINSQGRLVFPVNFWPELDLSVFETLEQFGSSKALLARDALSIPSA